MLIFTNPKINLGLNILGKRSDGYHDLSSIFYPIFKWNDALEIIEAPNFKFENSGLLVPGDAEKNLVVKAYRLLQKKYDLPNIHIFFEYHIHTQYPVHHFFIGSIIIGFKYNFFLFNFLNLNRIYL